MNEPKTRIAYLITDLDAGGAEKNLAMLAKGLDRARFDVSVASLKPPGEIGAELGLAGISVENLRMTSRLDLRAFGRCARWLERERPDILHTWLFHANVMGRIAALSAGVPRVVSSVRVAEPRRTHLLLERLTSGLADCILVNSPSLRGYMARHGLPTNKLRVIPNAVELGQFDRLERHEPHDVPNVLFVGRLVEQKGVDVLLRAAAELARRHRFLLSLAGDGPERAKLERLAKALGLANVTFLGRTNRVCELLAESDFLVLPSRWEGMPNVVLEALAAGCPVIGTDVIGTRDIITDGHNGLLVASEDSSALATAMERLILDPALARSLATHGVETARRYSPSAMIESHEALYAELIQSPEPSP